MRWRRAGDGRSFLRSDPAPGSLKKIQSSKGTGNHSETFYEVTSINELGQPLAYLTHNGQVKQTYEYYANSKGLKTLSSSNGATAILSKTYGFDRVANIKSITDNISSHTGVSSGSIQNLQYDDLHRLTGLVDASATRSYQYDALGNLIVNGDGATGTYTYGSSRPHAVTAANGKTYRAQDRRNRFDRRDLPPPGHQSSSLPPGCPAEIGSLAHQPRGRTDAHGLEGCSHQEILTSPQIIRFQQTG